ncbi:MAG: septal ring lytic transglycosylase RlpA family protein [Oscillospiraceae bacterium]|jgi:hypothetical protein|nr:septal ring lytic transglycosylase RlpA family protein [Oscillospiraceae bacterium]
MANTATATYNSLIPGYEIKVNNSFVLIRTAQSEAFTIRDRLNLIFSDANRDLEFITASYTSGLYVVCGPLVRHNTGDTTYFNGNQSVPEKVYETTNWSDSGTASTQSAIVTITGTGSTPWLEAFQIANRIRAAINLNFNTIDGNSTCSTFVEPANKQSAVASVISSSAILQYYAAPTQGTTPTGNNLNKNVLNGEVLHSQDLTAAMTSTGQWHTLYQNKFVKVTNLQNVSKSLVVRVTDQAPTNQGIELTYRGYLELGSPGTGANKVKIELLAT